jgi:hypothetical protein
MPARAGAKYANQMFGAISRIFGSDVGVNRKTMKSIGVGSMVASNVKRTKILGPTATTRTPNILTGRGSGRRFVSNDAYNAAHVARGKAIVGYGGMGVAGASMGTSRMRGSYNPPRPNTMIARGVGRSA